MCLSDLAVFKLIYPLNLLQFAAKGQTIKE